MVVSSALAIEPTSPANAPESTKARAWEGHVVIPTYAWEEDRNPKFWAMEVAAKLSKTVHGAIVYPYSMQDHLLREKADRTYKAVFLENEYLKVTCLPELGGRLHSVLDKTTGQETFHLNHVIKPSMIALRGAFISGGVEWNSGPQGHTVTILSPVDVAYGEDADGSAHLDIGNTEKIFRTRWTVRVALHPGRAYLDEQIRIVNPTDTFHPYYFWNCTSFPCRRGTRFIYPMSLAVEHSGTAFYNWPIHKGKDISWLKNYDEWGSIFAYRCDYDFFGAYDVDADRGIVSTANHHIVRGKKAWTWGNWQYGRMAEEHLTDDDGLYIEVQSGPLPTQTDYGYLAPRQAVAWQEWWYPVHGLGSGFEFANRDMAIQTTRRGSELELRILATAEFQGATCVLARDGAVLWESRLDLSPAAPRTVVLREAGSRPVDVTVKAADGKPIARFTTPLPIAKVSPPDVSKLIKKKPDDKTSADEAYLYGLDRHLAIDRLEAREAYEAAVLKDSGHAAALRGLAVLDLDAGLYAKAAAGLQRAVQRDPRDGLSWYWLGVSRLRLGDEHEALYCADQTGQCNGTAELARHLAGWAYGRLRQWQKAASFGRHADDRMLLAAYCAATQARSASEGKHNGLSLARRAGVDNARPPTLIARLLPALNDHAALARLVRELRAELGEYEFEMLEAALVFADMGLLPEAMQVLSAACVDGLPEEQQTPMPLYYLAYFAHKQGDNDVAVAYHTRARTARKESGWPSRPKEVEILRFAVERSPDDARGQLYLGNLLAHLGRLDEAVAHWKFADGPFWSLSGSAMALRNLGLYARSIEKDLPKAESLYRLAIDRAPGDQTYHRDLAEILIDENRRADAIRLLEKMPYEKLRRSEITVLLAQAYVDERRYDEAIKLLDAVPYFISWEGQRIVWQLFNKAHIDRGRELLEKKDPAAALAHFEKALTYPKNLGVGRVGPVEETAAQYWRGRALDALGRRTEAQSAWKQGAAAPDGDTDQNDYRRRCQEALGQY